MVKIAHPNSRQSQRKPNVNPGANLPADPRQNPYGRDAHAARAVKALAGMSLIEKGKYVRSEWGIIAAILAERLKSLSRRGGKIDSALLYRLALTAGIAFDKAWPKLDAPPPGNVIVALFGGVDAATVQRIVQPNTPAITVRVLPGPVEHRADTVDPAEHRVLTDRAEPSRAVGGPAALDCWQGEGLADVDHDPESNTGSASAAPPDSVDPGDVASRGHAM